MTEHEASSIQALVEILTDQSAAIDNLAASILELADALSEDSGSGKPETYLDGSPKQ